MRIGSGKHRGKKAVSGEETKRMKRNVDIKEISDGRLYEAGDLVKADTGGCAGCCDCCRGMGTSIILDPYDVWRLQTEAGLRMETMLQKEAELNVVDGLILPNLKMQGEEERCAFLDPHGRCSVHRARPGVCRLFPLGRYYQGWDFRYFLQKGECKKEHCSKVKVKKWLDTPQLAAYEAYIRKWHYFLEDAQQILDTSGNEELRRQVDLYLLKLFFMQPWEAGDFYPQFEERLQQGKQYLGIYSA